MIKLTDPYEESSMIVPETVLIDMERKGKIFAAIRVIGSFIIRIGARIRSLGYRQVEIHPSKALWEKILREGKLR